MSDWWKALERDLAWRQEELGALKAKVAEDAPKRRGELPKPAYKPMLRAI